MTFWRNKMVRALQLCLSDCITVQCSAFNTIPWPLLFPHSDVHFILHPDIYYTTTARSNFTLFVDLQKAPFLCPPLKEKWTFLKKYKSWKCSFLKMYVHYGMGATISIKTKIQCLLYAGFLLGWLNIALATLKWIPVTFLLFLVSYMNCLALYKPMSWKQTYRNFSGLGKIFHLAQFTQDR